MNITYKQFLNGLRFDDEKSIIFLMTSKYKIFYIRFIKEYNHFIIYWNYGNDQNRPFPRVHWENTLYDSYRFFITLIKEEITE